jgi:serine phosphatase RsbU (regulator of sigma subunit)
MAFAATQDEFELEPSPEQASDARRRFGVFCGVLLVLGVTGLLWFTFTDLADLRGALGQAETALLVAESEATGDTETALLDARRAADDAAVALRRGWFRALGHALGLGIIGYFLFVARRRLSTRAEVVSAATMMIVALGVTLLASRLIVQMALPGGALPYSTYGLVDLLVLHVVACLILSWTPRESALPFTLLLAVWAVTFLVPDSPDPQLQVLDRIVCIIVSPLVLVPGIIVAGWRWRRRAEDAERVQLGKQVASLGGELSRARIVHDAMFPRPFDSGHVQFAYDYRPTAEIGGDYVHIHVCDASGCVYLTLLDVAGHGLAAALTVNRLFGELERIRAEDPDAQPSHVMELLNRYINLTMAAHNLYATGTCIKLDPSSGMLTWVNAGHPPAFVRKSSGAVTELAVTTVLLGALGASEFESNQLADSIEPGDVVIAYTDGAFEARNAEGRQFGLKKIRQTAGFNPPPRDWTRFIANAVSKHHGGHAEDDVLIASLRLRSLKIGEMIGETSAATSSERR